MATYQFYQDKKVIIWERTYFTVEAESQNEADQIIKDQEGDQIDHMINIEVGGSEMLFDTSEDIRMEDNRGFSTLEIYRNNGEEEPMIANGIDTEPRKLIMIDR